MRQLVIKMLLWLLTKLGWTPAQSKAPTRLVKLKVRALELAQEFERNRLTYQDNVDGEIEVYNKLIREYPDLSTKKIASVVKETYSE